MPKVSKTKSKKLVVTATEQDLVGSYYTPTLETSNVLLNDVYDNKSVLGFKNRFSAKIQQLEDTVFSTGATRAYISPISLTATEQEPQITSLSNIKNLSYVSSTMLLLDGKPVSLYEEALCALYLKIGKPIDSYRKNTIRLNSSLFTNFLLENFICFVEDNTNGKCESYLATSSLAILKAYGQANALDIATLNIQNSLTELEKGVVSLVKITSCTVNYPLTYPKITYAKKKTRLTVSKNVKVTPLFMICRYWQLLRSQLQKLGANYLLQITYTPDYNKIKTVTTTLEAEPIKKLLQGTAFESQGISIITSRLKYDVLNCQVTVPNLDSSCKELGDLVDNIPLTRIQGVFYVPCSKFNYKNIDFEKQREYFYKYIHKVYAFKLNTLIDIYTLCRSMDGELMQDTEVFEASDLVQKIDSWFTFHLNQYGKQFQQQLHLKMLTVPDIFLNYEKSVML